MTWTKRAEPYIFILPAAAMILLFLGYPLVYNIGISFFRWQLAFADRPFAGLRNYSAILSGNVFGRVVLNTAVWTVGGVCLQMVVGTLLAVMADGMRRGPSRVMQSLVLLPWIIPGVVTSVIWMCMLQSDLGVVSYLINALGGTDRGVLWFSDTRLALMSTASSASAMRSLLYASDISGNRGPSSSSFGPISGLSPSKLMWSEISITSPL
jgi:multiple sugar transport system permease protein